MRRRITIEIDSPVSPSRFNDAVMLAAEKLTQTLSTVPLNLSADSATLVYVATEVLSKVSLHRAVTTGDVVTSPEDMRDEG